MFGSTGLPEGSVRVTLRGSAGQSFGAFNSPGVHFLLIGEANDYVGKGMAGGQIAIRPGEQAPFKWNENVISGNTILYGATGGELYLAGCAGERFAVRNSGATAVVEGVGDHGCEYMTGGTVVVLGPTGYNFGAGMTGGVAYILDVDHALEGRYNPQLVQLDRLNQQDDTRVRELLQRHVDLTSSPYAAEIMQNWEQFSGLFWRVMPKDAVARIEAANEGGLDTKSGASRSKATSEPVAV
jgi:glutamate synthase (ferredoxin)